uniref:Uncharacterized protein n=1 Tax=Glossina morsitans morsitans TaxID=37546 RepID=A0A1B0G2K3_GLOMM
MFRGVKTGAKLSIQYDDNYEPTEDASQKLQKDVITLHDSLACPGCIIWTLKITILLHNDRKSRHQRIKKRRRYERLAATSQLSLW